MPGYEAEAEQNNKCAVCGTFLTRVFETIDADHKTEELQICSAECLKEYFKDPEKYRESKEEENDQ